MFFVLTQYQDHKIKNLRHTLDLKKKNRAETFAQDCVLNLGSREMNKNNVELMRTSRS